MKDNNPAKFTIAATMVLTLWVIMGALGPLVYFGNVTPIWNDESVVHLHSFLALRTFAFVLIGVAFAAIAGSALWWRISFRRFVLSALSGSVVIGVSVLLFVPEWSPMHILYGELPSTNYREGFRPGDFLRLKPGMSKAQVENAIGFGDVSFYAGAPTRESTTWMYSGPGGENHWRYWLRFTDDGILEKLDVEYWWD